MIIKQVMTPKELFVESFCVDVCEANSRKSRLRVCLLSFKKLPPIQHAQCWSPSAEGEIPLAFGSATKGCRNYTSGGFP